MAMANLLFPDSPPRFIAFCGGPGRAAFIRKISEELVRQGHSVLIAATGNRALPVSGDILVGRDMALLLDQISKNLSRRPLHYLGRQINKGFLQGFSLKDLLALKKQSPCDYLLIELGGEDEHLFMSPRQARSWAAARFWDELVFYLDISLLDRPIGEDLVENWQQFRKDNSGSTTLSQQVLRKYLNDAKAGVIDLFSQKRPAMLFIGGVDLTSRENRAIGLARELGSAGIHNIAIGNAEQYSVKRLNF